MTINETSPEMTEEAKIHDEYTMTKIDVQFRFKPQALITQFPQQQRRKWNVILAKVGILSREFHADESSNLVSLKMSSKNKQILQ